MSGPSPHTGPNGATPPPGFGQEDGGQHDGQTWSADLAALWDALPDPARELIQHRPPDVQHRAHVATIVPALHARPGWTVALVVEMAGFWPDGLGCLGEHTEGTIIQEWGWQDEAKAAEAKARADREANELALLDPTEWTDPPLPREWLVQDWIPMGVVTAIYGDGGAGKSLLAQQLMTSVATGSPWLGLEVAAGPALGYLCEDDENELRRRQWAISAAYGLTSADLRHLRLVARLGCDNILMVFDAGGFGSATEEFARLERACERMRPKVVIIDTAADTFGGNEIIRPQVRQFINLLSRIATRFQCAVVLLCHPSQAGIASGAGTGGSTAWNNTVRSRLYFQDVEDEPNTRTLTRMKANYAARNAEISVVWHEGCFVTAGSEAGGLPSWEVVDSMFSAIRDGWANGKPWSLAPQSKSEGRYFPTYARQQFGVREQQVITLVQGWLMHGFLAIEVASKKTKMKGLQVIKSLHDG